MSEIQVTIDPRPPQARVLAVTKDGETILKARLCPRPHHARALATLLEAIALWEGRRVHAALVVGEEEPWCDTYRYLTGLEDGGFAPLYTIKQVERMPRHKRLPEKISGMGDFRDLRQLTLFSRWRP
jgi:hypothetical protein